MVGASKFGHQFSVSIILFGCATEDDGCEKLVSKLGSACPICCGLCFPDITAIYTSRNSPCCLSCLSVLDTPRHRNSTFCSLSMFTRHGWGTPFHTFCFRYGDRCFLGEDCCCQIASLPDRTCILTGCKPCCMATNQAFCFLSA